MQDYLLCSWTKWLHKGSVTCIKCKQMGRILFKKSNYLQKLSVAMMKFSEEVELPLNRLKFFFDGDLVDAESTPNSLELEGGECLDVHVLKKQ